MLEVCACMSDPPAEMRTREPLRLFRPVPGRALFSRATQPFSRARGCTILSTQGWGDVDEARRTDAGAMTGGGVCRQVAARHGHGRVLSLPLPRHCGGHLQGFQGQGGRSGT